MNKDDFHALYERYAGDVYRFAFYLAGHQARAEDVTSETFARAWTAVDAIRTETMKAYLFTIARNLAREERRSASRRTEVDVELVDSAPGPSSEAHDRLELRGVLACLQRLPESDRAALLMRAQEQMPYDEIARVLGTSEVAARVKVHRARLALAQLKVEQERLP